MPREIGMQDAEGHIVVADDSNNRAIGADAGVAQDVQPMLGDTRHHVYCEIVCTSVPLDNRK